MKIELYIEAEAYQGSAENVTIDDMEALLEETGLLNNDIVALEYLHAHVTSRKDIQAVYEVIVYDKDEYAFYVTKIFGDSNGFDYAGTVDYSFDEDAEDEGDEAAIAKFQEIVSAEKVKN